MRVADRQALRRRMEEEQTLLDQWHLELVGREIAQMPSRWVEWPFFGVPRRKMMRNGLSLVVLGEGDEDRFAEVFRLTWRRIPLGARRSLLKHWRESRSDLDRREGTPSPHIALRREWIQREPLTLGCWKPKSMHILFYAPVVDTMPVEVLVSLIAHEIGHAYLEAIHHESMFLSRKFEEEIASGKCRNPQEDVVFEILLEWGIDEQPYHDWQNSRFEVWKIGRLTSHESVDSPDAR
jgi:hypothetical protein